MGKENLASVSNSAVFPNTGMKRDRKELKIFTLILIYNFLGKVTGMKIHVLPFQHVLFGDEFTYNFRNIYIYIYCI
jgi:hypothetical protein